MNPSTGTADFEISHSDEYGLRLPNGEVIWPPGNWHGLPIGEPDARDRIIAAISGSAVQLGMSPGDLLSRFGWAVRRITSYATMIRTDEGEQPLVPIIRYEGGVNSDDGSVFDSSENDI